MILPSRCCRFTGLQILEDAENSLPALAREVLAGLLEQFHELDQRIQQYDGKIRELAQHGYPARRLMQVESIGPMTATAIVAGMGDPHVFKSGRNYAASLGLAPRQASSGGKTRLGQITKQGDRYLRTLLVHGARAYLRVVDKKTDQKAVWAQRLKERVTTVFCRSCIANRRSSLVEPLASRRSSA